MRLINHLLVWTTLVLILTNCKTSQTSTAVSSPGTNVDTLIAGPMVAPLKINYLITQKGDTLDSLFMEVDIAIDRLLPDTINLMAVGDIMMGTKFPNESYLPGGNGEYLWNDTRDLLSSADITFGNLEGTVLDGEGIQKTCSNPKACYLFKMPTRLTPNLLEAGFDLISVANNHANDFGKPGRLSTQRTLDSLDITYAGSVELPHIITRIGHLKVGFVAFAPNVGTLTFYDEDRAKQIVAKLDSLSDIVIVSIHGGAEGSKNMHLTKEREFYYGEDRGNIYEFSHAMIDTGADVILGHGPHVVRAIEVYHNKLIAYSLGNFLTYGRFNLRGVSGEAPLLEINIDNEGNFLNGQIHSFYQSYSLGPELDSKKRAMRSIKKLTEEDFPENPIIIDDKGIITYIQN
ncbi:MAG: capsule biosynthesis protein CapA [Flammeovirgaceae bacterium]|nr:capsule biosynthesis protein CapA [Flammeovirgaceae bacterium]HCX21282.1 capsule biosynthesis protein CapA [Cytophagales bacterium]|tara:strand:- start:1062 stop:2270 length:1209 start_codon:yes stop_codon:yes gene_type:complete